MSPISRLERDGAGSSKVHSNKLENSWLCGFCVAAASLEERGVQSLADIFGEGNGFGVAKNLNGFACGIDDDSAIGATRKVEF
jgi:hypothetical protein